MRKIDWKKYLKSLEIRFGSIKESLKKLSLKKYFSRIKFSAFKKMWQKVSLKKYIKHIKFTPLKKLSQKISLKKCLPNAKFSWGAILYGVPIFFLLYYPVGAILSEHIDTDTQVEIKKNTAEESDLVNAVAYIINKETNDHMWTPNMPIIFPGYILDNMPEFQTGEIKAAATVSKAFAKVMKKHLPEEYKNLDEAAKYLAYSPKVWFFSEKAGKFFAPSSSTQYNKAKKELMSINHAAAERKIWFAYSASDLQIILDYIYKDLQKTSDNIKSHIRENSHKFVDTKADNVFYNTKGKLYAYYILLKALGEDYKSVIVDSQIYPQWTSILKCLENAVEIDPWIIKNSDMSSSFSPNHLAYLNMYVLCAAGQIKALKFAELEEVF